MTESKSVPAQATLLRVEVVSDIVCPWCFVGKRQLEQAIALMRTTHPSIEIQVRWHPFQLNPGLPQEGIARSDYLKAKFGSDDTARFANVRRAAAAVSLELMLESISRQPNTLRAHALIAQAADAPAQDRVVEALFVAYFQRGSDLTDERTLREIALAAGLSASAIDQALQDTEVLATVAQADQRAREAGVNGVPCFIANDRYALSGAQGAQAIIEMLAEAAT
jgi:predicted DsbA family dithiol-disulfide isomerase